MLPATADGGEPLRVQQLVCSLAPEYLRRFGATMPARHRQVLKKIVSCRTPASGGQLWACPHCEAFHYRYHSCNDRHCPQCGQTDADAWLQRQRQRLLLPTPYFLVTFTVPEALRRFLRSHSKIGLDLLFAASARALQDLAGNPKRLGAQLGMLGVLHTWSRTLIFHPHIHYLVPGGGLTPDGRQWVPAKKNYLLPIRALGARVRTLFQAHLQKRHPDLLAQVPAKVWKRRWIVDSRPVGSGEHALRYLARYVFKTATGNRPVQRLPNGQLRWDYRHSQTRQSAAVVLEPLEWLRRFLQHILPQGFARVRTFGWLHPAAKVRANRVRALLQQAPVLTAAERQTWKPPDQPDLEIPEPEAPTPSPTPLCPRCQRPMQLIEIWHAGQPHPQPEHPP